MTVAIANPIIARKILSNEDYKEYMTLHVKYGPHTAKSALAVALMYDEKVNEDGPMAFVYYARSINFLNYSALLEKVENVLNSNI